MSEVRDRYSAIAGGFTARLSGVRPGDWLAPSPCTEWTARDVAAHVVDTHHRVLALLGGQEPPVVSPREDVRERWQDATGALMDVLGDEARASKTVRSRSGEQPFESLVGTLLCADTLLHTWDLARATGQDERLDADAVAKAMEFLAPADEAIRRPGGFAQKIEPAPDADAQTRLLNFCGRAV